METQEHPANTLFDIILTLHNQQYEIQSTSMDWSCLQYDRGQNMMVLKAKFFGTRSLGRRSQRFIDKMLNALGGIGSEL